MEFIRWSTRSVVNGNGTIDFNRIKELRHWNKIVIVTEKRFGFEFGWYALILLLKYVMLILLFKYEDSIFRLTHLIHWNVMPVNSIPFFDVSQRFILEFISNVFGQFHDKNTISLIFVLQFNRFIYVWDCLYKSIWDFLNMCVCVCVNL